MWYFDICVHYKIIITIKLITYLLLHIDNIFVSKELRLRSKTYYLSIFQVCNTVSLTIVTLLYIRCPELIHLAYVKICALQPTSPYFSLSQSPATPVLLSDSMSLTIVDSLYKWDMGFLSFCAWLILLSIKVLHVHLNGQKWQYPLHFKDWIIFIFIYIYGY